MQEDGASARRAGAASIHTHSEPGPSSTPHADSVNTGHRLMFFHIRRGRATCGSLCFLSIFLLKCMLFTVFRYATQRLHYICVYVCIHVHSRRFSSITGHYKVLTIGPCWLDTWAFSRTWAESSPQGCGRKCPPWGTGLEGLSVPIRL